MLDRYRAVCETIIFGDFEYAAGKGIEAQLWAAHLKVNSAYRKGLRNVRHCPMQQLWVHGFADAVAPS